MSTSSASFPKGNTEKIEGNDSNNNRYRELSSSSSSTFQRPSIMLPESGGGADRNDPEYNFYDTAKVHVCGGMGGNGCVSFRREKGEARGGPNGGNGGDGGSIYLLGDRTINTLSYFHQHVHLRALPGRNGLGKGKHGAIGRDIIVSVPLGTIVRDLLTQKYGGEVREHGQMICIARGGRGGRGNGAFATSRRTAPKLCERGGPGASRWLSLELKLVADVGFVGLPNCGKSTLLSVCTAAKPKIADYPFTTIVPHLGVCDLLDQNNNNNDEDASRLVLCDIPGLIEGASQGIGMGDAFLRHVQKCSILLHIIDGNSDHPIQDYHTIQKELQQYDQRHPHVHLMSKTQVIVINKMDIPQVQENVQDLIAQLRIVANHTRIIPISAVTTYNVKQLMQRTKTLMKSLPTNHQNDHDDILSSTATVMMVPEIDLSMIGCDDDKYHYRIIADPSYPNQFKIMGAYIEYMAKMTHWEYPEAVERFGRQLIALGITDRLLSAPYYATDGDLIMIDQYDFTFTPGMTNPYIPQELLQNDRRDDYDDDHISSSSSSSLLSKRQKSPNPTMPQRRSKQQQQQDDDDDDNEALVPWRPFRDGGYLDMDRKELRGYQLQDHDDDIDIDDDDDENWNDVLWIDDGSADDDNEEED